MLTKRLLQIFAAGVALMLVPSAQQISAQNGSAPALTGKVTSDAEGAMEGVVVSAKKAGSTVAVSVISDAQGQYRFPANRLGAGKYTLKIRAIGYDLAASTTADVADEQTATVDLKLRKTKNLVSQMSNAEWMMSLPGSEEDKAFLLILDHSSSFTATIYGFCGNGTLAGSDHIDLKDINFNSLQQPSYADGLLTVSDGTHTAALPFDGSYQLENFKFVDDGHNGTLLYGPP